VAKGFGWSLWYNMLYWDICESDSYGEKKMESSSNIKIKKSNGHNFELWKLKMEDFSIEKDKWIIVDLGIAPTRMSTEDWMKLY